VNKIDTDKTGKQTAASIVAIFCMCLASSLAAKEENSVAPETIVVQGKTWTADPAQPWAEALAARGEHIVAVGSRAEIARFIGPQTKVIDAGEGLVVPGLIDSHVHLVDGGLNLKNVQLRDARTREEFVRRIGDFARGLEEGEWILGGDWDHTLWGGEVPDRAWIDAVTPKNPLWLYRVDGHMGLANSAALVAAEIDESIDEVEGGEIERDATGRLTGVFKDDAMPLIEEAIPDDTMQDRLDAVVAAMDYLVERGVTAVHHMGSWQHLETFRVAHRRGLLKTRIYACVPLARWQRLAREVKAWGRGDDWLKIGGLKGFVDGSLGSRTAAFLEPFADEPGERGLLVNTVEDLEEWTAAADKEGLQVMVHAIGDRAVRLQLDLFERVARKNSPRDRRFRIEHAQHIAPADLTRFAELGVIASMQPYHAIDDGRWAEQAIGPDRSETAYAYRSLLESGARLAFGSDWPVAPATPLEGVYAAVTRRTLDGKYPDGWVPQQRITVEDALRAYTIDAAYASFSEASHGSIEPGKLADIVIVNRNLLEMPAAEIDSVQVETTIVGGKVMYRRGAELQSAANSEAAAPSEGDHKDEE
jgi:predicted amidohydrolase YtcJ